jgi:hypothetical protein
VLGLERAVGFDGVGDVGHDGVLPVESCLMGKIAAASR